MNDETSSTQSSSLSELPVATTSSAKIDMVFRLWTPASTGTKSRQNDEIAARYPGVLALIEDAAAARQGVLFAGIDPLQISGLSEPADALVVSRQIQQGMLGFRGKAGVPPVAVSIAIDYSGKAASAGTIEPGTNPSQHGERRSTSGTAKPGAAKNGQGISHDLMTLLMLAKPAQILITHDLGQRSDMLKGLPLKTFPGRFGVYEYLWTTEEKLDLLQSEPQLTLSALSAAVPAEGAKRTGHFVSAPVAVPASETPTEVLPGPKPAPPQEASRLSRPVLFGAIGLGVAVLVGTIGVIFVHGRAPQPATGNSPASAQISSPVASTSQLRAPVRSPASTTRVPLSSKLQTASSPAAKKIEPVPTTPAPVVVEKPATPPEAPQACTLPGDLSKYIGLAEGDRERGDYTSAIRIFRQVLACDPNNPQAHEGLTRAIQGEQTQQ